MKFRENWQDIKMMFTLTWIAEKELELVTQNKGDEFHRKKNMKIQSSGERMRNASGQQGAFNKEQPARCK